MTTPKSGINIFLQRNPNTCFVAISQDQIIGTIISGHDGRRGYIYHTAVSEKFRKQGIGQRLVETSLAALKAEGINKVALVVFTNNQLGNLFWEKLGFIERKDIIYRDKALVEMEKSRFKSIFNLKEPFDKLANLSKGSYGWG